MNFSELQITLQVTKNRYNEQRTPLNPSRPNPGRREKLKAFVKPFQAPQRSAKINIYVNFYFNPNFLNAQDRKG